MEESDSKLLKTFRMRIFRNQYKNDSIKIMQEANLRLTDFTLNYAKDENLNEFI